MVDLNVASKQRIQVGFFYEPVRVQSFSRSVKPKGSNRWKNLKRRIGWQRINILWFSGFSKQVLHTGAEEELLMISGDQSQAMSETTNPGSCIGQILDAKGGTTMNLATALAADRRQINVGTSDRMTVKSMVRLFEEIDGRDVKVVHGNAERGGIRSLCCHCTERNKEAALIPCGHTYCRICSRSMWAKQERCPLCNRSIMDTLEIF